MSDNKDPNIEALLRELEGYIQYGKPDRAAQVRADLKRRGYVAPDEKKAAKKAAPKKAEPADRAPRKQVTADPSAPKSEG